MRRTHDLVLEMPDGDEDLVVDWIAARLRELAQAGRFERVLIEVSGTSNPTRLARHFGLLPGEPETFSPWAELHQNIGVVDALDFYRTFVAPPPVPISADLIELQRAQIASASLLVLNKCDLVDNGQREACVTALMKLNLNARWMEAAYGEVPLEIVHRGGTPQELGLEVEMSAKLKAGRAASPESSVALGSALYRAYRPFHPERFWAWFNADHPGLLRVKGLIWLATRSLLVGGVSRTRWQNGCGSAGIWWAALPREDWPEDAEVLMKMQETWQEPYGDRRQELVLIGDEAELSRTTREQLDACLLTEEEYALPFADWKNLKDPFPAWDIHDGQ